MLNLTFRKVEADLSFKNHLNILQNIKNIQLKFLNHKTYEKLKGIMIRKENKEYLIIY